MSTVADALREGFDGQVEEINEAPNEPAIYDGLLVIGRLVDVRPLKSNKTGNVIEGIANAVFESSRGEEIVALQRVLRTPLGAFNLVAFGKLTDRLAVGQTWCVTVGKQVTNGFTNYVAIDCKEL